jgi:signal transduction histidine kinase
MRRQTYLLIFVFILLALLIWINYYHALVEEVLPFGPSFVPGISGAAALLVLLLFIELNRENEIAKNDFMSIVTHKFRTPLTAIRWSLSMLKSDITNDEKQLLLKRLDQASTRMSEIIDLIVKFAKFDSGMEYAYKAASFREMVYESLDKNAETLRDKNIKLDIAPLTSLPLIVIDQSKIQFVIDSLIDNAIRYTPAGGTINIFAENKNDSISFIIKDTGIGIQKTLINKVSRRFYRTPEAKRIDTEGLGMSLYTAKSIIKRHGGKLFIESKGENLGTTITVEIPKNK